jgi:hypothetical protein
MNIEVFAQRVIDAMYSAHGKRKNVLTKPNNVVY